MTNDHPHGFDCLTEREIEVLQCAANGMAREAIARELCVSPSTVKTHFANVYSKLGATDRAHAIAIGFRAGLIR